MVMTPVQEVGMTRRIAGQMARALAVGRGFALMGIGASGQQVGKAPLEVRVPVAPQPAVALGRTHLVWEVHITNVHAREAFRAFPAGDQDGFPARIQPFNERLHKRRFAQSGLTGHKD